MYPTSNCNAQSWNDGESPDTFDTPKGRQPRMLEDIPEPPDFWTLEDFEDLLFVEVD